jgi:hypothetical protein
VFMPSGAMAQSIALLVHATDVNKRQNKQTRQDQLPHRPAGADEGGPRATGDAQAPAFINPQDGRDAVVECFACYESSHLLLHEEDGYRELLGMKALAPSTFSSAAKEAANPGPGNRQNSGGSDDDDFDESSSPILPRGAGSPPLDFETVGGGARSARRTIPGHAGFPSVAGNPPPRARGAKRRSGPTF